MSVSFIQDSVICHQDLTKSSPGILLNSLPIPAPTLDQPPSRHRQLSSSEASSSSSTSPSRSRSPRRIRFAPLPEPRRSDVPFSISNSPFEDSDSDAASQCPPTPPDPPDPRSISALMPEEQMLKPKLKSWSQKFLAPFLSPLKQPYSDVNLPLFRTFSHDSATISKTKGGGIVPLPRPRTAEGRTTAPKEFNATTQVVESHTRVASEPAAARFPGSKGSNTILATRMLNGRVYRRRPSSSHSSRATASYEPEFIEWGYGGMGSVNTDHECKPGTDWTKLQRQGKVLGSDDHGDDDGSGMGWVKKRREQREREKRAQEEEEKKRELGDSLPEIAVHPPAEASKRDSSSQEIYRSNNAAEPEHHVYQAVIPALPHPHHHRRRDSQQVNYSKGADDNNSATPTTLSRNASSNTATLSCTPSNSTSVPLVRTPSDNAAMDRHPSPIDATEPTTDMSSASSYTSTSASSIDGDEDEEDEEEEEIEKDSDEELDEVTRGRITSKGAGVEKVSRHSISKE